MCHFYLWPAVHKTTGYTPARLMMGRELRLPIDLAYGRPREEQPTQGTDYVKDLQERLENVHHFARCHLSVMSDRMKHHYDSRLEGHTLEKGDPVWLHNPQRKKGLTPKLTRPWQGPYVIVKRINNIVYRIQLGPKSKPKVVHRNRLWKYSGQDIPTWFQPDGRILPVIGEPLLPEQSEELEWQNLDVDPVQTDCQGEPKAPSLRRSTRSRQLPDRYRP